MSVSNEDNPSKKRKNDTLVVPIVEMVVDAGSEKKSNPAESKPNWSFEPFDDAIAQWWSVFIDENVIPEPEADYPLKSELHQKQLIESACDARHRQLIEAVLKHTDYVTWDRYMTVMRKLLVDLEKEVGVNRWRICLLSNSNSDVKPEKSNLWICRLALRELERKKSSILNTLEQIIDMAADIEDSFVEEQMLTVFFDDASYSGDQLSETIHDMYELGSKNNLAFVPFMSTQAIAHFKHSENKTKLLYGEVMKTLKEKVNDEKFSQVHVKDAKKIPTYFAFKVADHVSTFPDIYAGVINCTNKYKILKIPVISNCDTQLDKFGVNTDNMPCPRPPYKPHPDMVLKAFLEDLKELKIQSIIWDSDLLVLDPYLKFYSAHGMSSKNSYELAMKKKAKLIDADAVTVWKSVQEYNAKNFPDSKGNDEKEEEWKEQFLSASNKEVQVQNFIWCAPDESDGEWSPNRAFGAGFAIKAMLLRGCKVKSLRHILLAEKDSATDLDNAFNSAWHITVAQKSADPEKTLIFLSDKTYELCAKRIMERGYKVVKFPGSGFTLYRYFAFIHMEAVNNDDKKSEPNQK